MTRKPKCINCKSPVEPVEVQRGIVYLRHSDTGKQECANSIAIAECGCEWHTLQHLLGVPGHKDKNARSGLACPIEALPFELIEYEKSFFLLCAYHVSLWRT